MAAWISAACAEDRGSRRSMPSASAPMDGPSVRKRMVMLSPPTPLNGPLTACRIGATRAAVHAVIRTFSPIIPTELGLLEAARCVLPEELAPNVLPEARPLEDLVDRVGEPGFVVR